MTDGPALDLEAVALVNADVARYGLGLQVCVSTVGDCRLDVAVDDRELLLALAVIRVERDLRVAVDELAVDAARHVAKLHVALAQVDCDRAAELLDLHDALVRSDLDLM